MLMKKESAQGVFYINELSAYVKVEADGENGTKYALSTGKQGTMPLVSRIKLKEALASVLGQKVSLLLLPDTAWPVK